MPHSPFFINSEEICKIPFGNKTLNGTLNDLADIVKKNDRCGRWFACVNAHSVELTIRDKAFKEAVLNADLVTADGVGIVIASRILGGGIPERVCGPDIFPMLCEKLNMEGHGTRMFFMGSTPENLLLLKSRFEGLYPNLIFAGSYSPPYKPEFSEADNEHMIHLINNSQADVLWVGLGAPKQEKWVHQVKDRLNVKLIGPVGGVFDFMTGRVKLPPKWVQNFGMISLYRLCQEPKRLWRRNMDTPVFLLRVVYQRLRDGKFANTNE